MRKRLRLGLGLVLCALAAVLLFIELHRPEPVFRGKPLSVWIKDAPSPSAYESGFPALLQQRPSEMLPYLIRGLKTRDNPLWKPYVWVQGHAPRFIANRLPDWILPELMRAGSARWLAVMGPVAKDAAPALRQAAAGDKKEQVRCEAIYALVRVGLDSNDMPVLVRALLADPSSQVRGAAAGALEIYAPNAPESISALIQGLADRDAVVRQVCAATLAKYGERGRAALPELRRLAGGKDEPAADYAKGALRIIEANPTNAGAR
jgi:hypothetical protein